MGFNPNKERLNLETPPEIVTLIRIKAAEERLSVSDVATALFCEALSCDPKKFGIGAKRAGKRTRTRATAAAS